MLSRFDQLLVTCVQPSTERNSRNSFVAVTSSIHMSAYDHTSMGAERCLLANTIATIVQTVWRINRCLLCANCQNALGMIQNGTEAAGKLSIITPPFTSMTISPGLAYFCALAFGEEESEHGWGFLGHCCCHELVGKSILKQGLRVYNFQCGTGQISFPAHLIHHVDDVHTAKAHTNCLHGSASHLMMIQQQVTKPQ